MSTSVPRYEHVLVPVDESDANRRAVAHAIAMADAFGASVHALSISEGAGSAKQDQLRHDKDEAAQGSVEIVEERAMEAGIEATTAVRSGVPHEVIVGYARDNPIDLIVMGTHDRSGLERVLDKSVAEQVVRESPVPVVTVRAEE